jgi:hypothetical protein
MSIARTSHRPSARVFLQLHKWHTRIACAGAQKDVVRDCDRACHAHGQWLLARIGKHHEKFGTAEVKRAVWRSRRPDAARSPRRMKVSRKIAKVSRQVSWLRCSALAEKVDLRPPRSCSDCSSHRACSMAAYRCMMRSGGGRASTRDQSVASAADAPYHHVRDRTAGLGNSDVSCALPPWSSN